MFDDIVAAAEHAAEAAHKERERHASFHDAAPLIMGRHHTSSDFRRRARTVAAAPAAVAGPHAHDSGLQPTQTARRKSPASAVLVNYATPFQERDK